MPTTILRSRDGILDGGDQGRLDALRARLQTAPVPILLHLHGGLVPQASGEAVAEALSGTGPLSFNAPAAYEQIYVVWRTGALETIRTNWQDLFDNDRLYRALFKRLIAYVSGKVTSSDNSRSVGLVAGLSISEIERRMSSTADAPFADLDEMALQDTVSRAVATPALTDRQIRAEFGTALQTSGEFNRAVEDLAAAISWDSEGRSVVAPHGNAALGRQSLVRLQRSVRLELEIAPASAGGRGLIASAALLKAIVKHGVAIAIRVIGRLRAGRGHGVHATIVEEIARELYGDLIGAAIWGMMKKDAYDHFGAGKLGSALVGMVAGSNHRLVVTAHSAGAIWAAALMLEAARVGAFPKFTLVLLAPAVRATEFAAALDKAAPLLDRFRIFTMKDEFERVDPVLGPGTGVIYPSSLLYLVSGLFEETAGEAAPDAPLVGMQRFIGRPPDWLNDPLEEAAVGKVRAYLGGVTDSVVYSKAFGAPGLSTDAIAHGDFDNNQATLDSVHSFL